MHYSGCIYPVVQLVLLVIASINASPLNITHLLSNDLSFPPHNQIIPNPYYVPGSPIALDFYHQALGPIIPRRTIIGLLDKARQDTIDRLAPYGDIPIQAGTQQVKFEGEVFVYESSSPERRMMYSELLSVIRGFGTKLRVDGYRHRAATVLVEGENRRMVETGEAALLKGVTVVIDA